MAFKFNAILNFNSDKAIAGMERSRKGFDRMRASAKKMGNQARAVGQGIKSIGLAAAPATAGFALAARSAANFEEQMSTVQSVILGTEDEMRTLSASAKEMGATTVFSARQAAEGQEFLARAGFQVKDIISALPGVLDAAAASGVGLAEAADIVAGQIGAFGLEAKDASKVADSLSLTTALTNTNFTQLGEAMKFAAPAAKQAGLSLAETASSVGVLANAGVKGSLAGTALKNALSKLAKPSKDAVEFFGGRNGMDKALFRIVDGQKKLAPMEVIMSNIQKIVAKSEDPLKATAKAFEILGLRGATSFSAFSGAIGKETKVTDKNLKALRQGIAATGEDMTIKVGDTLPSLVALRLQIAGAAGTAKEMARIRLDNLKGQFTLFQSATEGVAIELGSLITGPLQRGVKDATAFMSAGALAFQQIISGADISEDKIKEVNKSLAKFGISFKDVQEFAQGFVEGFREIKQSAFETFRDIQEFLKPVFGGTNMTVKEFGKLAAKIITIGAIAAPVIGAIAAGLFILGPIISGVAGFFGLITSSIGVLWGAATFVFGGISTLIGALGGPMTIAMGLVKALGAVIGFLMTPIGAVIAGVALIGAGFVGIWRRWDEIKQTFADKGFWAGIWAGFKAFFAGIGDLFMLPIKLVKNAIMGLIGFAGDAVKSIGKGLISGVASFLGLSKDDTKKAVETSAARQVPGRIADVDRSLTPDDSVFKDSARNIGATATETRTLAAPPSAEENAAAMANANAGGPGGGSQNVNVNSKVVVEGRIRGKDLVLIQTKEQISQTEMNGQQIDPAAKQKMLRNGAPMGGF